MATTENGIYYPNDYSKKADVPNDMKKMAESIDPIVASIKQNIKTLQQEQQTQNTNISNLQKDNTKNKEDITELQKNKETVNTQLETLQEEIKELEQDVKANAIIEETEKEKSLYISDASGARGRLEVLGNVEQEVTETSPSIDYPSPLKILGDNINLFNKDTITENAFINTDGNISNQEGIFYSDYIEVKENEYFSITGRTDWWSLGVYNADKTFIRRTTTTAVNGSVLIPTNGKYIRINAKMEDIDKIKVEKGSIATSYSPYGQGSTEIIDINKNLARLEAEGKYRNYRSGEYVNSSEFDSFIARVKQNKTYYASNTHSNLCFFDKNMNYLSGDAFNGDSLFNTNNIDNVYYITLAADKTKKDMVQIEEGDTATGYEEHKEQKIILDIQQPMLKWDYFDLERKKEVHNLGHYKFTGDENFKKRGVYNNLNVFYLEGADVPFMYKLQTYTKSGISNASKTAKSISYASNGTIEEGIQLYYNSGNPVRAFYISFKDIETVEDLKAKIKEIDFYYYYEVEEPTELDLTESQIQTLEQLNKLRLYKGVNNIFTLEDIALLQAEYGVDIQTKFNNISTQLLELGGN